MICEIESVINNNVRDVTLHGEDDEFCMGLSKHQIGKTRIKLRHVLKALKHASKAFENEDNLTWRDACNQAANESLCGISGRFIETWHLSFKSNSHKLPISKQGMTKIRKDLNIFLQLSDEDSVKNYREN